MGLRRWGAGCGSGWGTIMADGSRVAFVLAVSLWAGSAHAEPLSAAVEAAVATNPAVLAAGAEARGSAYEVLQLQSEYQPAVRLFGEAGPQWVNDPSNLSSEDNEDWKISRTIGIEAEVVLFDGYRRANLVYASAARVDGNIFRLLDASETMALNATEVYIDVYRHRALVAAAEGNLERHRAIAAQVAELVDGGRLPLSDRLQVEDRVRAAELAVIEVRRALEDANARYTRIVGRPPSGPMSIPVLSGLPRNSAALLETAVQRSYRVRVAETELNSAAYAQRIVEADRSPRVTLNAGGRYGQDVDGASGDDSDLFVGLRFNWTLYQGGRTPQSRALIEARSKAMSDRNVAIREVRELSERTWNGYRANGQAARVLADQLASSEALVGQFRSEFEAGTRSLLDVLEAERVRFDVEFEKLSADASFAFSTYRLLAVESRLAEHFGVKPANMPFQADFESRALAEPRSVFRTAIPALE
jgi:adhesin transport system outer membrane protein